MGVRPELPADPASVKADKWVQVGSTVIREHFIPRTSMFTPTSVRGAPEFVGDWRVTRANFEDGSFKIIRDNWKDGAKHRVVDGGRRWTGTTTFYASKHAPWAAPEASSSARLFQAPEVVNCPQMEV